MSSKQIKFQPSSLEDAKYPCHMDDITQIDENIFASRLPRTSEWKCLQELEIKYVINLMMEPHNEKFVNEHGSILLIVLNRKRDM